MITAAANPCIIDSANMEARAETRGGDDMGKPYQRGGIWWVKIKSWDGKWKPVSSGERATRADFDESKRRAAEYRDLLQRRENDKRHAVKLGILTHQDIAVMDKGPTAIDGVVRVYLATITNAAWRRKNTYLLNRFIATAGVATAGEMGKPEAVLKVEAFLRQSREAGQSHDWIKLNGPFCGASIVGFG